MQLDLMLKNLKLKGPLIHAVTNYVSAQDCANTLLACGASAIMADDPIEVAEITSHSDGLVLNMGTWRSDRKASMVLAGLKANALKHPLILDPVGVGASSLRVEAAKELLETLKIDVVRGNISEIKTLALGLRSGRGVDAAFCDLLEDSHIEEGISFARELCSKTKGVVAISGATDIVVHGRKVALIKHGHPMMGQTTGTGCMLSVLIAAFVSANPSDPFEATCAAIVMMGLCGEIAYTKTAVQNAGTGTFKVQILDALNTMSPESLKAGAQYEYYA